MSTTIKSSGLETDLDVIDRTLNVRGKFLVDAGCGDMSLARQLAERGASVLAIDPDPVQAEKNRHAATIANVGFVEAGAQAIPVESRSVDGVLFPYSLHHVPTELFQAVFDEMLRILKPDGFLYVLEPVAEGDLNEVMRLFHDEALVRAAAQTALDTLAIPRFQHSQVIHYNTPMQFASWDEYAERYVIKSYNDRYTEADVRAEPVRRRFHELGEKNLFRFEVPKKVTFLSSPVAPANT